MFQWKIQKKRNILKYPNFSGQNLRYSRVLLFYPLKPNEVIYPDDAGTS